MDVPSNAYVLLPIRIHSIVLEIGYKKPIEMKEQMDSII